MNYTVLALALPIIALQPAKAGKLPGEKMTLVYNDITEGSSALDRDAKNAYAGKFRFIDIKQGDGLTPGRMKGFWPYYSDPRPMREETVPGKVVVAWVVTPEGRVIEPRVVHSTDKRVASLMIHMISLRTFVPARVRGAAVFSIWLDEFAFGSDPMRPEGHQQNGLGIQGQRDR